MVVRENVKAVVVAQHHRVPRGVECRRRELPAGRVRRVVESALHATVDVVENHLKDKHKASIKSTHLLDTMDRWTGADNVHVACSGIEHQRGGYADKRSTR